MNTDEHRFLGCTPLVKHAEETRFPGTSGRPARMELLGDLKRSEILLDAFAGSRKFFRTNPTFTGDRELFAMKSTLSPAKISRQKERRSGTHECVRRLKKRLSELQAQR